MVEVMWDDMVSPDVGTEQDISFGWCPGLQFTIFSIVCSL
jgi:hypothetical protein